MIEFEAKIKGIAVPVESDAYDFELVCTYTKELRYLTPGINPLSGTPLSHVVTLGLPTLAKLEIIGLSSEILKNEVLARKVVDNYHPIYDERGYRDYYRWEEQFGCYTRPTDSFQSLLDKYNIVGEHLIIKRK